MRWKNAISLFFKIKLLLRILTGFENLLGIPYPFQKKKNKISSLILKYLTGFENLLG